MFLSVSLASAQERAVIRIYSATDTAAIAAVVNAFEERYSSLAVEYTEFNTRELYEAMLATPGDVDVVISSAMDLQTDLVNRGLAYPFVPQAEVSPPDWAQWLGSLYGFTYEPVAVIYNKSAFAGRKVPGSRSELASMIRDDPAFFNGRIGTYDISLSGVGYTFATQDAQRGYQFSRLVESFGRASAKTYCCTSDIVDRVARGDLVFGYNVIGSYAQNAAKNDGRIGITLFNDYALVMTRTAFIARTSQHKSDAALFISFLLSEAGQTVIAANSALLPLTQAARSPAMNDLLKSSQALLPIRLGPGLLTYLDTLKKNRFLDDWRSSMTVRKGSH
jgi:ABC-type Fe3+ transport system substrate-binding protein